MNHALVAGQSVKKTTLLLNSWGELRDWNGPQGPLRSPLWATPVGWLTIALAYTLVGFQCLLEWGPTPPEEWMNEWMNEWSIYIALYCVLLYTQSALQSYGGVSSQPPPPGGLLLSLVQWSFNWWYLCSSRLVFTVYLQIDFITWTSLPFRHGSCSPNLPYPLVSEEGLSYADPDLRTHSPFWVSLLAQCGHSGALSQALYIYHYLYLV